MLHVDPHKRLSANQVLQHPWIQGRNALPDKKLAFNDSHIKVSVVAVLLVC